MVRLSVCGIFCPMGITNAHAIYKKGFRDLFKATVPSLFTTTSGVSFNRSTPLTMQTITLPKKPHAISTHGKLCPQDCCTCLVAQ